MKVIKTEIPDVLILEPKVFGDSRGYFFESFSQREFDKEVAKIEFVQHNESCSSKGVVRGMHFQKPPFSQAKLVRCVKGKVRDVALDIRKDSPTYGKYIEVILSAENHRQLFIPKGFAHGFEVLSDQAVFLYLCDEYYHPEAEGGINAFDPDLGINWSVAENEATVSDKDRTLPLLKEI